MPNYFGGPSTGTTIIQSEEILLPDYVPDELLHRDRELQAIADSIKPILTRRPPQNLFIHGPSGCGKTTCVKYLVRQLMEQSSAILPVYVNCWKDSSQMAVYNRIVEEMRLPLPRRGLAADEVFDRIMQFIRNYKKPVLLVLDEVDGLEDDKLLYAVSRSNEKQLSFGIIGITNNKSFLAKLDSRVRSSLRFFEMEFREYSEEQLTAILRIRAEKALAPGTYDGKLLLKIARSVDDGSARVVLERLWKAAKHAESAGRAKIMLQDLEDILSERPGFKLPELGLTGEEALVLEILKIGELPASAIYERFTDKMPKTKRQIRNYLEMLEKKKLIVSRELESEGIMKPKAYKLK